MWTWCSESVRVSPTALACCTPTEPTRRRQAARPARLNARETLNPEPACCAAQTRTCDLVPTGSLQNGIPPRLPAAVVWLTQSYRDGLMRNYGPPAPDQQVVRGEYGEKAPAKSSRLLTRLRNPTGNPARFDRFSAGFSEKAGRTGRMARPPPPPATLRSLWPCSGVGLKLGSAGRSIATSSSAADAVAEIARISASTVPARKLHRLLNPPL